MANFIMQGWDGNTIQLRPHDPRRRFIGSFGLDGLILYFNTSDIYFDLRLLLPDDVLHKNIEGIIDYEWILCDKNNQPLQSKTLGVFSFAVPFGQGEIHYATNKKRARELYFKRRIDGIWQK
jgi:hypothetical protein